MQRTFLSLIALIALGLSCCTSQSVDSGAKHTLTGDFSFFRHFHSKYLPTDRDIIIYLPPGYDVNNTDRYPVLYEQDGQNVFDSATSFFPGQERHMDEAAERLISTQQIQPLIIVGIYSTGNERINEYTPTKEQGTNLGGQADLYGRMLVEEIKPLVDSHYRTKQDRSDTALGGSSLGGVLTMYLGIKYPNVFSKLAVVSPAAFWDNQVIVRDVQALKSKLPLRIWLDVGTAELPDFIQSTRALRDALVNRGWVIGKDLMYMEALGGTHTPESRALRVEPMLKYLFPK